MTKRFKQLTLLASRTFISNSNDNRNINFLDINPVVKYYNANVNKVKILADNRNKSGVYLTSCGLIKKTARHMWGHL